MQHTEPIYNVKILGHNMKLRFVSEDSPTKAGVNMQFVFDQMPEDVRDKQVLADKINVALQKKFGAAGIALDYNDRNPYENVISFIVPMQSISKILIDALKK